MSSLILQTATRYLLPLLLLFSIFLLVRGHNEPGGGFIGGLVAAAAFALLALADKPSTARRALRAKPQNLIGAGLLLATASGLLGMVTGRPFLSAAWSELVLPIFGKVGTPLTFDIGVYLVVIGVTLTIVFTLAEEG